MSLFKYKTYLIVVGGILALIGITHQDQRLISYILIMFGCYWWGLGMGLSYKTDNGERSMP